MVSPQATKHTQKAKAFQWLHEMVDECWHCEKSEPTVRQHTGKHVVHIIRLSVSNGGSISSGELSFILVVGLFEHFVLLALLIGHLVGIGAKSSAAASLGDAATFTGKYI